MRREWIYDKGKYAVFKEDDGYVAFDKTGAIGDTDLTRLGNKVDVLSGVWKPTLREWDAMNFATGELKCPRCGSSFHSVLTSKNRVGLRGWCESCERDFTIIEEGSYQTGLDDRLDDKKIHEEEEE